MAAACQEAIPGGDECGVQAVGRCSTCYRTFCASHAGVDAQGRPLPAYCLACAKPPTVGSPSMSRQSTHPQPTDGLGRLAKIAGAVAAVWLLVSLVGLAGSHEQAKEAQQLLEDMAPYSSSNLLQDSLDIEVECLHNLDGTCNNDAAMMESDNRADLEHAEKLVKIWTVQAVIAGCVLGVAVVCGLAATKRARRVDAR